MDDPKYFWDENVGDDECWERIFCNCMLLYAHDFGVNAQLFLSSEYEFSHEAYFPGDRKRLTKQQAYCVYGPIH